MCSTIRSPMLKRAVHLLLAAELVACPVLCGMLSKIHAAREQTASASPHTCGHCCQAPHDDTTPQQNVPTECPCKAAGGNCICNGALVKPTDFELSIAPNPFACLPGPAGPIASDRTASPADSFHTGCLPCCDGRSLRALICSLLC